MTQKSYMQLADEIMGGALSNPSKSEPVNEFGQIQEELPELTESAHSAILNHVLEEDKVDEGISDMVSAAKKKGYEMKHRAIHFVTGKHGPYSWKNKTSLPKVGKKVKKALTVSDADKKAAGVMSSKSPERYKKLTQVKPKTKKVWKTDDSGTVRSKDRYGKQVPIDDHMQNLSPDKLEILKQAKEIVSEMTTVGMLGVSHGRKSGGHHPALQVKLPGDKHQSAQIKAASTPPVYKAEAAKDPAPAGVKKTRVIVKRKSPQSKDDETQKRIHNDMKAMYHESFDNFVNDLLTEDYKGRKYLGDVSVAEFGRKGPANDTFGGGGVKTKGRGPKVKLTSNQLMTAKKKGKGVDKDHETKGFGNASSHSRKHPQNPYAGSK